MPAGVNNTLLTIISILKNSRGFLTLAGKYAGISVRDYVEAFQNPTLKAILYYLMPPDLNANILIDFDNGAGGVYSCTQVA